MGVVRNRITAGDGDPRHGSRTGYTNHGCRCRPCTDADTAYKNSLRARRAGNDPRTPHGTPGAYTNWACRCTVCTAAWAFYIKTRRLQSRWGA